MGFDRLAQRREQLFEMNNRRPTPGWPLCLLGGADLEMSAIRDLLSRHVPSDRILDKSLRWGARISDYTPEITNARLAGEHIVCIELADDLGFTTIARDITWIDHHDARAGANVPTSLEQLFQFLNCPANEWTRELQLIAANDRGHITAMQAIGASPSEIQRIRAADRAAQGITAEEDAAGRQATCRAEQQCGGHLTVVHLPHSRSATVTDSLHRSLGGSGYQNLLILCSNETDFFGSGVAVKALDAEFPGGWHGGELPCNGFWGYSAHLRLGDVLNVLIPVLH